MALSKDGLRKLYRKRAAAYDFTANLYYLIGFREAAYRKKAVAALALEPGDTVVEIGCGTGLNFGYLLREIGESGRLVGVDLTDAMLQQAERRINRKGWRNVELIRADAAEYDFTEPVAGVISSFALTLVPEYEAVIEKGSRALGKNGRMVVLDFKLPEKWPFRLVKFFELITRPFGVSLDLADRKPWRTMKSCFANVSVTELYGGLVYIAVGRHNP
ncbi:MAG: class I SAM-dependent methyltransferase [Desulfurivibrionaceae bacterium]